MALREIFARFATEFDTTELDEGEEATSSLTDRLTDLGNVLAGAAIVQGIRSFASEFVGVADEIGDTAAMLGMSTDALQSWRHAAQLSGVEASQLDGAFIRLQDQMAANNPVFRQLGVNVRDANGELRSAGDVLSDLADPIAALDTDAERTGTLMDLLGRSGARLGPLFSRGSEGIAEVRAELEALGGGVTPEAAEAAGELDDAMVRLDTMALSLKSRLAVFLLPALERLSAGATALGSAFSVVADRGRFVEATLVVVGGAAAAAGAQTAAAWVAAAAPFIVVGALILGLILIVEDLWTGFEGGKSVIGDLGETIDDWAENVTGPLEIVAGLWLVIRDNIRLATDAISEIYSYFSGDEDLLAAPEGSDSRGHASMADVRRIREERAAAAAAGPAAPSTPVMYQAPVSLDSGALAGFAGRSMVSGVGTRAPAAPQITNQVRVQVDASGLSEAEATRVATTAVERALTRQAADTADTLAGPWDRG